MSTTQTPESRDADRPTPDPAAGHWWRDGLRPLLLRLHFYVGLLVGPFLLVAALTGLLYAFTPQLEQSVHAEQLRVPVGARKLPLAAQVAAGQAAVPEGRLSQVRPGYADDATTRVVFRSPLVDDNHTRTAFIDPYSGQVRGVLTTYGEWLPIRSFFDDLHRNLLLGEPGRLYSELAASWLWVLALGGLALWWGRTRRGDGSSWRRRLLPRRGPANRGRLVSRHAVIGTWALLGMLFLSATGLTWSKYAGENIGWLRGELNWKTPSVTATLPKDGPGVPVGQLPATAERVFEAARAAGLDGPVAITPANGGGPWQVAQVKRSWPVAQDAMAIDPQSATVLRRIDFADWPVAAKLTRWGIDAHMGLLFGVANQIALGLLALGIACSVIWGYRMWWLRRPTRGGTAARMARPLGAGRAPGRIALLSLTLLAIGIGVAFPVLGGSLLLFLGVDAVWQALRTRAG